MSNKAENQSDTPKSDISEDQIHSNEADTKDADGTEATEVSLSEEFSIEEVSEELIDEPAPPAVPDEVVERIEQMHDIQDDTSDAGISLDDVEREQRGRISLTEYSNRQRHNKRVRIALTFLATILVLMLIALIVVGVLMFIEADKKSVSTSAQQDSTTLLEDADEKEKVTATAEVVNLVGLMGLSKDEAIAHIGHGAIIESETPIEVGDLKSEVVVPLTEEQSDPKRGTPTVVLRLYEDGLVGWASYTAPTSALGYGTISFVDAIQSAHVIQNSLRATGLSDLDPSVLNAPSDSASYSTYDTDGKTLITEQTSFNGTGKSGDRVYDWSATLTYDYSNANQSGNLADTIRRVSISIEPSA